MAKHSHRHIDQLNRNRHPHNKPHRIESFQERKVQEDIYEWMLENDEDADDLTNVMNKYLFYQIFQKTFKKDIFAIDRYDRHISSSLATKFKEQFEWWWNRSKFDWANCGKYLCEELSDKFHDWWNEDLFNWTDHIQYLKDHCDEYKEIWQADYVMFKLENESTQGDEEPTKRVMISTPSSKRTGLFYDSLGSGRHA